MTYRTLYSGVTFPRTLLRSAVSRKGGHGTRHLIYFEVICPMGIDFSKVSRGVIYSDVFFPEDTLLQGHFTP